jgi:multicomponent Na+:H+ antiporter subunit D
MSNEGLLGMAIAVPLVGWLLIVMTGRLPGVRDVFALLTAVLTFACVAALYPAVMSGAAPRLELFDIMPGLPVGLSVEPLGLLYALVITLLWVPATIYGSAWLHVVPESRSRLVSGLAPVVASSVGIAFADNLLTMFILYQALILLVLPLVARGGVGTRLYIAFLLVPALCLLLPAVAWTWTLTLGEAPGASSISFVTGGVFRGGLAAGTVAPSVVGLLYLLFVFGIATAALVPVHLWLPAAASGPAPVSAYPVAVVMALAGVFCFLKVTVYTFGVDILREHSLGEWLLYVAGATVLIAGVTALFQDNLKRRLAYITVSQLSLAVLSAALLTPMFVLGAVLHLPAIALGTITLFFAAGSIEAAAGRTRVSELNGVARHMPFTLVAFIAGSLSLIGVPPLAGFTGRWHLLQGVLETFRTDNWLSRDAFVLLAVGGGALLYACALLPVVYRALFLRLADDDSRPPVAAAPYGMTYALGVTAGLLLVLYFWQQPVADLAELIRRASV